MSCPSQARHSSCSSVCLSCCFVVGRPDERSTRRQRERPVPLTGRRQTYQPSINTVPGLVADYAGQYLDGPAITVDNFAGASQGSVYLDYVLDHDSAKLVFLFRSTPGGTNWTKVAQLGFAAGGAQVAIGTNHEVYVVWKEITNGGTSLKFTLSKSTNLGTNFSAPVDILTNNFAGYDLQLTRSNSSDPSDYFSTPITPVLSVNPV